MIPIFGLAYWWNLSLTLSRSLSPSLPYSLSLSLSPSLPLFLSLSLSKKNKLDKIEAVAQKGYAKKVLVWVTASGKSSF